MVETCIYNTNNLLSAEFRIEFDDAAHAEQTQVKHTVHCPKCKEALDLAPRNIMWRHTRPVPAPAGIYVYPAVNCAKCRLEVRLDAAGLDYEDMLRPEEGQVYLPEAPKYHPLLRNNDYWDWCDEVWRRLTIQHQRFRESVMVQRLAELEEGEAE